MHLLRLVVCLAALGAGVPVKAQYTFGSETTSGSGSPNIAQIPGTTGYEYTTSSGSGNNLAYIPLTGSSATVINTSTGQSGWTVTLTVDLSARSVTNSGSQDADIGMGLTVFSGTLSDHVVMEIEQENNSDGGDTSDFPNGFYGTAAKFAAETNGAYNTTTPLGNSVLNSASGGEGDSYLQLTGGTSTANTASTQSLTGAYGIVTLSYNSSTQIITGYYNGTPVGSFSLAGWGSNPPLTLVIAGASGPGAVVALGADTGTNFSVYSGLPSDVGNYSIQKQISYDQTSASAPTLDPSSPYQFNVNINTGTSGALIANATLTPPVGATGTVAFTTGYQSSGSSGSLYSANFQQNFATKAALDAAFPNGTYNFALQTTTPNNYTDQLTFASQDAYPAVPQITSVTGASWSGGALVVTDVSQPVTINWTNPGNSIYSNFYINSDSGVNLANNYGAGLNTYTIPANTLSTNSYYQASIQSSDGDGSSDAGTIPGNYGGIDFQTQVSFTIQTGTGGTSSGDTTNNVVKSHVLVQTSASGPVDATADINNFEAGPYNLSAQFTAAGTVTGPSSTSLPLAYSVYGGNNNDDGGYDFNSVPVTSASSLNAAYPDGTYTFPSNPAESVSVSGSFPAAPVIVSVNSNPPVWDAQGQLVLDPTIQNIIAWNPVTVPNFATLGNESASIGSDNGNFQSIKKQAGALSSSTTAFTTLTIPASAMTPGSTYHGKIQYVSVPSAPTNPSPNVYFVGGYITRTEFEAIANYPTGLLQAITFPALANQMVGAAQFTLNATASSGLPVSYSVVSGPATLSGPNNATVTVTGAGTVTIQASQSGSTPYGAAANVQQSFTVSKLPQTITFPGFGSSQSAESAGSSVTLAATASSGLAVTYQITAGSGLANLSGANNNILTFTGNGTVTVEADQAGNATYAAAAPMTQTFNVTGSLFGTEVQSTSSANIIYNSSTGAFQYTDPANSTDDNAYIPLVGNGANLITTSTGWTASVTANLSARSMTSTGSETPDAGMGLGILYHNGNNTYIVGMQLGQANNTGSTNNTDYPNGFFGTIAEFNASLNGVNSVTTALGTSGSYNGDSYQIISGGTSSSAGAESISAASGVLTLTFNAATDTVTGYFNGVAIGSYSLAAWGSNPSPTLAVFGFSGEGINVTSGTDTANNFSVGLPLAQTITFPPIAKQKYAGSQFALSPQLSATASSGLPVSYTYVSGPATLSGTNNGTVTVTGTGTVVIQASQPGNANYAAATNVMQSFAVASPVAYSGSASAPAGADGISPLLKYFFDLSPSGIISATDRAALPVTANSPITANGITTNFLTLTYRQYALVTGYAATVETSPDLQTWTPITNGVNGSISQIGVDPTTADPLMKATVMVPGNNEFIRLHVAATSGGGGG